MSFKDSFTHQEAVKALRALDDARGRLESAQSAFEDAASFDEAHGIAESMVGGIEDLLSDFEVRSDGLRERLAGFDEYDSANWDDVS